MKRSAWMAALALCLGNTAHAAVIDLVPAANSQAPAAPASVALPDLAVTGRDGIVLAAPPMSELPEPEVFAMMLVGLILIGYRAGREQSDTFR